MILIISTCAHPLHEQEFVKPIENSVQKNYATIHYTKLKPQHLKKADKIIICGTSIQDNAYLKNKKAFDWLSSIEKPVLGICAGMQILSIIYGAKIKQKKEIGYYDETFTRPFLNLQNKTQVYHLHSNYTTLPRDFTSYTRSTIPQAIKHNTKPLYGVLFHPEVRNKRIIETFIHR